MLRILTDENIDIELIRGILRSDPYLDIVRVQEAGLTNTPDELILAWAAREGYAVLTRDIKTMPPAAYARLEAGQPMPGMFVMQWDAPIGPVLECLLLLIGAGKSEDWEGRIWYLPSDLLPADR